MHPFALSVIAPKPMSARRIQLGAARQSRTPSEPRVDEDEDVVDSPRAVLIKVRRAGVADAEDGALDDRPHKV
jgi:hypothetical protein